MTLVLFDIDGTLVNAHGLGRRTIERALGETAGRPVPAEGVAFAGRTDPAIAADMLRQAGYHGEELSEMLAHGLAHYTTLMQDAVGPVERLPGVEPLLERLDSMHGIAIGLLTGNMELSAFAKLRMAGIDRYFAFGAFGSDDPDRYALPRIATRRARRVLGMAVDPSSTIVVGDTPHDVGCGRGAGMRTVAVTTGPVGRDALDAAGPDLLVVDFRDPRPFLDFLTLPKGS